MKTFSILIGMILALVLFSCTKKQVATERPNIVWITSEDNSTHYMKLFDEHGIETPNIERLAEHGITYTRAFSNAPVCSAARSTLISACYGPRMAAHYHRKQVKVPMPDGIKMYPYYLRKAGYYTANNNKEDYNIIKGDTVWNDSSKKASWRNRKPGQPFFYIQNFGVTHESSLFFTEKDMQSPDTLTNRNDCFIFPTHPKTEVFKYTNARYRDKIATLDKQIGRLLDQLEKDGLMENTFIFYYGDHGGVLPGSKGYLMEVGLHVPLVVYVPEKYKNMVHLKPGSKTDDFVSFIDFAPTILNLAGAQIPDGIDGKPFLGKNITEYDLKDRNFTFGYADRFDEKYDMVRSVRVDNWKYIRNYQPFNYDGLWNNYRYRQMGYREWWDLYKKGKLNDAQAQFFKFKAPEALYNIDDDPFEIHNLAEKPEYAAQLSKMRNKINSWVKEMPDLSFYPEFYLVKNAFDNPVAFGQENKENINELIDVANLELLSYSEAKPKIEKALSSDNAWKRYWGIIVCSSFKEKALEFLPLLKKIAQNDSELMNRVRAAEFLGITGKGNPVPIVTDALYQSTDGVEALLILNSAVMLKDGYNFIFNFDIKKMHENVKNNAHVKRRFEFFGVS